MSDPTNEPEISSLTRELAGHLIPIYLKHIDEYNPFLTKHKEKLLRAKPSHSFKPYERCEYKILERPPVQLFKNLEDDISNKSKTAKKSSKGLTSLKKRIVKTTRVSNLYFDPNGDSLKRYKEMYTYKKLQSAPDNGCLVREIKLKNHVIAKGPFFSYKYARNVSPGIRTVTNIQEAVRIFNEEMQKERIRKNYIRRRKKKIEEMLSMSDPQLATSVKNSILDQLRVSHQNQRENLDSGNLARKLSLEEPSLSGYKKFVKSTFPSKDFLERNKCRRLSQVRRSAEDLDRKSLSLGRLPPLPSEEFLTRNLPRRSLDEDYSSDYLLRVKRTHLSASHRSDLVTPIVKAGFHDDRTFSTSDTETISRKKLNNQISFDKIGRPKDQTKLHKRNFYEPMSFSNLFKTPDILNKFEKISTKKDFLSEELSMQSVKSDVNYFISNEDRKHRDESINSSNSYVSIVNIGLDNFKIPSEFESEHLENKKIMNTTHKKASKMNISGVSSCKQENLPVISQKISSSFINSRIQKWDSNRRSLQEYSHPNSLLKKEVFLHWENMKKTLSRGRNKIDIDRIQSHVSLKMQDFGNFTMPDKSKFSFNKED